MDEITTGLYTRSIESASCASPTSNPLTHFPLLAFFICLFCLLNVARLQRGGPLSRDQYSSAGIHAHQVHSNHRNFSQFLLIYLESFFATLRGTLCFCSSWLVGVIMVILLLLLSHSTQFPSTDGLIISPLISTGNTTIIPRWMFLGQALIIREGEKKQIPGGVSD